MVLLAQNIFAQRTITVETETLRKGDTCALYSFKNGMPVLLKIVAATEDGKVTAIDTTAAVTAGIYSIMLPSSISRNSISILYSKEEKKNIDLHFYAHNQNIIFKDSDQNNAFASYLNAAQKFHALQHNLEEDFLNESDTIERKKIRNKALAEQEFLFSYGKRLETSYPNTLLAKLISCINTAPIPNMAWSSEHMMYKIEEPEYQNAVSFAMQHYWDGVDFADNILINTPYLSGKTKQYISLFNVKDFKNLTQAITDLLQKAAVNPEVYRVVEEALFNMYLVKNSGYFNDEIGILILKNEQKQSFTPDWRKDVISSQISFIEKNKIGSVAVNIPLKDQNGLKKSILTKKTKYTILYFFNPDCSHCMKVTPIVKEWFRKRAENDISVLAIYVDNDEKEWRKYLNENSFPQNWINLWGSTDFIKIRTEYWLDNIPSIYLLDENKKVILKDVNYNQLINYFNKE